MELAVPSHHPTSSPAAGASACAQNVLATSLTLLFLVASAKLLCRSAEGFAVNAIVLVYYTGMIHLQLVRKRRSKLDQVMLLLMLAATGITFVSVATVVLVFHPDWRDLLSITIFAFFWAALLIQLDHQMKSSDPAKCQDASVGPSLV